MSKARKQSRGEESAEIFADDEFDADEFVEHQHQHQHHNMDDKGASHQRPHSRGGWRRLEELREQKMLRDQLLDLKDWDELEEP